MARGSRLNSVSIEPKAPVPEYVPPPVKKALKAKWLPGLDAPMVLDGSMAGDVGFDPLGFASSQKTLYLSLIHI